MSQLFRALIVDDSELSRMMNMVALGDKFTCDMAEDGLIAVEKYIASINAAAPYHLIFMDVCMPEMDGKAAVRKIREYEKDQHLPRIPIYMVTASESLEGVEDLVEGLMRKPGSKQIMGEIVQKHLGVSFL